MFLNYSTIASDFSIYEYGYSEDEYIFPVDDFSDPHHEFDEIIEAIKHKTSPLIRFAKLLSSKSILWIDSNYLSNDFHASNFRTLIKKLTKHYGKGSLKMLGKNTFTKEEELSSYDLIITDGENALQVLKTVMNVRETEMNYAIDMKSRGEVNYYQEYLAKCPIILVHDDKYISGVSELRKDQLVRFGAFDYTTDNESLTTAIIRALSVMEHGNNF